MGDTAPGVTRSATNTGAPDPPGPAPRSRRQRANFLPSARRALVIYTVIPVMGLILLATTPGSSVTQVASYLPTAWVDVSYSFLRMLFAYLLSLGFSLAYGYYAATHRGGERVMIPVLDVLQSVPILGFFPFAVVVLAALTPGSPIGPNLASIFLIFTSMAWNMVFGVYESLKSLPGDLKEAADSFGLRGWLLFRRVLYPATINRLVYNSVLSWTAGWFFLVEAEIFTTNTSEALQGIGSYLSFAASTANGPKFLAGIIALVVVIAVLDFAVWRPLGQWAERFRYDQTPSGESVITGGEVDAPGRFRRARVYVTERVRSSLTRITTPLVQVAAITVRPGRPVSARRRSIFYYVSLGSILVVVWLLLIALGIAIVAVFSAPIEPSVRSMIEMVPAAVGASTLRLVIAYLLCLAIALPLAIWIARSAPAGQVGLPIIEVIASFPATALFPVIIFQLVPYITPEGASIVMLMTGMMWYLFFNLLSGVRALPPDLTEAARSYGVKGMKFYRRVLFPGIFGAFITGSITAFGGGWNTTIVAEYLQVGNVVALSVLGLGQLIDIGYSLGSAGYALMASALFAMVATVLAINEFIWKPLYRRAATKYRYD